MPKIPMAAGNIALGLFLTIALTNCQDAALSASSIKKKYPNSSAINETARFIAALDIKQGSQLHGLTADSEYAGYKKEIDTAWDNYNQKQLVKIREWRKKRLADAGKEKVFYPLSGPDIVNALVFFPEATEFVMIGLEKPGLVPAIDPARKAQTMDGLRRLRHAMRTLLSVNLFRTLEMQVDFKHDTYHSITGIMLFFITRLGYEILDVQPIYIKGDDGTVRKGAPPADSVQGVEVVFWNPARKKVKTARYFSVNVANIILARNKGFHAFLMNYKADTTFLKSASYQLGLSALSTARDHILSRSEYVIQGDSGIPLGFFKKGEWELSFYGKYRILKMFSDCYQKDLDAIYREKTFEMLPFSFDYGFVPAQSNMMVARKKKSAK